jgi:phage baseplate assembly protein W
MVNTPVTEIWSDLHQSISPDAQGNLRKVINIEAVRTSIDNILGTSRGERVFLPEFAIGLRGMVFEPLNANLVNRLSNEVKNSIEIWDPRVTVIGVDFKEDTDNNYIELTVRFNIVGYAETFNYATVVTQ